VPFARELDSMTGLEGSLSDSDRRTSAGDLHDGADADASARRLLDGRDKEELRQRHYGLLQELRVLLPGVQVLVAFLLTVPFDSRFTELDSFQQGVYGFALVTGMLAIVCFVGPTALHRVGNRTARAARLELGILLTRIGLVLLALTLIAALFVVTDLIFGRSTAVVLTGIVTLAMVWLWLLLPTAGTRRSEEAAPSA
jgi:hypothetical protein